ncbi:O-methyltransferase [Cyclobacterium xiamenense]|uniref:hypothetical protein n=1 Tax=Cyclobacterium xiamenense TaxID=1297121 RepID=UPI0012B77217|nr:hypothetical protein [Cyclobacterium xiamenense]
MDNGSRLTSIDNDAVFLGIVQKYLGADERLALVLSDGTLWEKEHLDRKFDFIFADTWHGKYLLLDEIPGMVKRGGLYLVGMTCCRRQTGPRDIWQRRAIL